MSLHEQRAVKALVFAFFDALSKWERCFLTSLLYYRYDRPLTQQQSEKLSELACRHLPTGCITSPPWQATQAKAAVRGVQTGQTGNGQHRPELDRLINLQRQREQPLPYMEPA